MSVLDLVECHCNDVDFFFDKDEQITRMLPKSRLGDDEKRTSIRKIKEEIVAECHNVFDQLQGDFGCVQSSLQKHHQKTEQTFRSINSNQRECTISQAELASRINKIEDEREVLRGDLLSMKDDVNSECNTFKFQGEFSY